MTQIVSQGTPITVDDVGPADPSHAVLLIGAAVPAMWGDGLSTSLAARGLRAINFDYRSDGTVAEPQARTSLDQVADAVAVLDALDVESATVLGYSRGAVTAFGVALRHPERVDRLVLLTPVSPYRDLFVEVDPDPVPSDPAEALGMFLPMIFSDEFIDEHPDEARRMIAAVESPNTYVVRTARRNEEPLPDDTTVNVPTLMIVAGDDQVVRSEHADRLEQAISHAQRVDIDGARHGLPMEHPDTVAELIADFVRS